MKKAFSLLIFCAINCLVTQVQAQNLIANSGDEVVWTTGSGSESPYTQYASSGQNTRENVTGPYGTSVVAWKVTTINDTGNNGGWTRDAIALATDKTYRFTVWVRSESALSCLKRIGYLGNIAGGGSVDFVQVGTGSETSQPQPLKTNIQDDTWFLYVGYLGPNGYSGSSDSGMYAIDNSNPNALPNSSYTIADWTFPSGHTSLDIRFRTMIYNCGAGDVMYTYAPRIEEVNANTKPLLDILYPGNTNNNVAVTSVAVASASLSLEVGQANTFSVSVQPANASDPTILWSSSNTAVATVNSAGSVTAVAAGSAILTATAQDDPSLFDTVSVTVTAASNTGGGSSGASDWSFQNGVASFSGKVGVNTLTVPDNYQLAIDGKLIAEEVRVELSDSNGNWPDYVFSDTYELPTLAELKKHIDSKGHLPNIPSADEVATSGIELGEMNRLLLEKIEELTLYLLQQEEINKQQQKTIEFLLSKK